MAPADCLSTSGPWVLIFHGTLNSAHVPKRPWILLNRHLRFFFFPTMTFLHLLRCSALQKGEDAHGKQGLMSRLVMDQGTCRAPWAAGSPESLSSRQALVAPPHASSGCRWSFMALAIVLLIIAAIKQLLLWLWIYGCVIFRFLYYLYYY